MRAGRCMFAIGRGATASPQIIAKPRRGPDAGWVRNAAVILLRWARVSV